MAAGTSSDGGASAASPMGQIDKEQLETMVVDIFDELSRRSVEEEWQASTTAEERKTCIPALFLPVIEGLSQERLQVHRNSFLLGLALLSSVVLVFSFFKTKNV